MPRRTTDGVRDRLTTARTSRTALPQPEQRALAVELLVTR